MPRPKDSTGGACFENFASVLRSWRKQKSLQEKILVLASGLSSDKQEALLRDWILWARKDQLPPPGEWTSWLIMGGRGAGKTRAGAEWVRGMALGLPPFADKPHQRIALVGETYDDARDVMIEGVSGLLAIHRKDECPVYEKTRGKLTWPNGASAQIFSAEEPDGLRGPQFYAAWCDEVAKWRYLDLAWNNLQFALRLGDRPRQVITTTPRPVPLLKKLLTDQHCAVTRTLTSDNAENLSSVFFERVVDRYAGTRLGRQELEGELIEERDDALWSRDMIDASRVNTPPELSRIVIAVDPAVTSHKRSDACGIVAVGKGEDGHAYVLEDATLSGARPDAWAARAIALYKRMHADCLIAEVNQGGDVIESVIHAVDPSVPVTKVRASRGKFLRAEPVAALYAKTRIHHVGALSALEDEMCDFGTDGLSGGRSPDRLDALVWAISSLKLDAVPPLIRRL